MIITRSQEISNYSSLCSHQIISQSINNSEPQGRLVLHDRALYSPSPLFNVGDEDDISWVVIF